MIPFARFEEIIWAGAGLVLLLSGLLLAWNLRRPAHPLSRRGAVGVGVIWVIAATFEYWLFGPSSALGRPDEYNVSLPWIHAVTHVHLGGPYFHGYAGGVDARIGVAFGAQFVSFERLFFCTLPLWAAISLMNLGAIGLGYTGGYRLARAAFKVSRGRAVIVGLVASGTHLANLAWAAGGIGWAIALMPWAAYFLLCRSERRGYFAGAALLGLLYSASSSVIHGLPALCTGLALASLFVRPVRYGRFIAAGALFCAIAVANWADAFFALAQVAPEGARANVIYLMPSVAEHLRTNADVLVLPLGGFALACFAWRRDRGGLGLTLVFWFAFASGHLLGALPWRSSSLGLLAAYRWDLVSDASLLLGTLLTAHLVAHGDWIRRPALGALALPPLTACYLAALPVVALGHHKAINWLNYRGYGGVDLFTSTPLLTSSSWRAHEPFRVVSDYALFAPNTANAYGLETYDGSVQAFTLRQNRFHGLAVLRPRQPTPHTHVHFFSLPAAATGFGAIADLDALRIANVRYILTTRPLADPDLRLVAYHEAEPGGAAPAKAVAIHELEGTWPRAFMPASIHVSSARVDEAAFYDEVLSRVRSPSATLARDDAPTGFAPAVDAFVLSGYRLVPGGVDLDVAPGRTPGLGLVVVNLPYSRLWQAMAGGQPRRLVPVNGIHVAIVMEPGDRHVTLRYQRRSLLGPLSSP